MRELESGAGRTPRRSQPVARAAGRAWAIWRLVLLTLAVSPGCGPAERPLVPRSQTFAELRMVRQAVTVVPPGEDERIPYPRERLVDGQEIRVGDSGLAWLRCDGGATLLVRGPAQLVLRASAVEIGRGRVFVDTPAGSAIMLATPGGPLRLSRVRASVDVAPNGLTSAYALAGELRGDGSIRARAGEMLTLERKLGVARAHTVPVLSWEDWTGGLATTDRTAEPSPYGVGTVGARRPGDLGAPRSSLAIQKLDVSVRIDGDLAITEVDERFFNPSSEVVEGLYRFRAPEGAILHRFGVDRHGVVVWGRVQEHATAAAQYQADVYQGSTEDPALLEWDAPGAYRARLYPIGPGEARRVVIQYTQWLERSGARGERRLYVYPMAAEGAEGSLPHIEELTARFDLSKARARDVRVGMAGARDGGAVVVRAQDLVPRADLAVELFDDGQPTPVAYRAAHSPDLDVLPPAQRAEAAARMKGEADYVLVAVRATELPLAQGGLDLVVVIDSSAATSPGSLQVARAATNALLTHLGKDDRAVVLAGDATLRPVVSERPGLAAFDDAARRELSTALASLDRGGATDLGAMLTAAAKMLDPARRGAVVYIGDGAPTVGELSLGDLRDRLSRLPRPVRIFGLGVGDGADMVILRGLARGTLAERIDDGHGAARAALRLLETAERPARLGASVALGPRVERVFPRDPSVLGAEEPALVVGRVVGGVAPERIELSGPAGTTSYPLRVTAIDDRGDLRRRWAVGRLAQMLDDGAGRAAMADLGSRNGIITPFTSLYVPTANEMSSDERADLDRRRERERRSAGWAWRARSAAEPQARGVGTPAAATDSAEGGTATRAKGENGSMGEEVRPSSRFGVRGPSGGRLVAAPSTATASGGINFLDQKASQPGRSASEPRAARPAPPARVTSFGMVPPASGAGEPRSAPVAPWGRDDDFGVDASNTIALRGAPRGDDVGRAFEATGLGLSGVGAGGDGRSDVPVVRATSLAHGAASSPPRTDDLPRAAVRCGAGAQAPLEERALLWRERLSRAGNRADAAAAVYRRALAMCEAPTWLEQNRLLWLMLDALTTVTSRVELWRMMSADLGVADTLYRGMLTRVRTPEQMRELHAALGLKAIGAVELDRRLHDLQTPADRVKGLRALSVQWPDDFTVALELLNALEDIRDEDAAVALGRTLRARPDADARVRTAVGELLLRLARRTTLSGRRGEFEAEGRRAFGEIVEFSGDDPVARRRLGDLLRAHGWHAEAARQYETLAKLAPDDATVSLLRAAAAEAQGMLEEAVKWTEKGGAAGAPDAAQGPATTARALAATFLAWGRQAARDAGRTEEIAVLAARSARVLSGLGAGPRAAPNGPRVALSWSHPELHPALWSNALGAAMPAPEGDVTLGIAQVTLPAGKETVVEIRLDQGELKHAARLGAEVTLTVVWNEAQSDETVVRMPLTYDARATATTRFVVSDKQVRRD